MPEKCRRDPQEPLKFAYWVPNVSGGLVVSKIEQRTDWGSLEFPRLSGALHEAPVTLT